MNELILYPNDEEQIKIIPTIIPIDHKALPAGKEEQNADGSIELGEDKITEYDFDGKVSEFEKTNYIIAASCGLFAGALNILWSKEFDLDDAHNWGKEKVEKVVMKMASQKGYKGNTLNGAIEKLEKLYPFQGDKYTNEFGGGLQHHLRDFSHHPSLLGLLVSILMQYGIGIGTNVDGTIKIVTNLKNNEFVGKSFGERIYNGTINWIFHLISDVAGSSSALNGGTGIPGPILSTIKELSTLPVIKDIKIKYDNDDIAFSQLISKLFNGTYFKDENGNPIKIDFRTEIGLLANQTKSVILNECLVRGMYSIRALYKELKTKNIKSIEELKNIDFREVLPIRNRMLSRMLTISSGVFVLMDTAKAVVKSRGDKVRFFLNLNYVGLGRFLVACVDDVSYYLEDEVRKKYYNSFNNDSKGKFDERIEALTLNEEQAKILTSLKLDLIKYDISQLKNKDDKKQKEEWCKKWKEFVLKNYNGIDIIDDREVLYETLNNSLKNNNKFYLLFIELYTFKPYFEIEGFKVEKYKVSSKYFKDVFEVKQNCVDAKELKNIKDTFNDYKNLLQNKRKNAIIASSVAVAATVATGGISFAFAPEIAAGLLGGSFAGLHGAALASASLAAIGGGAVAAGGLGVAGGTMILTGGGALLGLATSGATATAILNKDMDKFFLISCAELLTYCKLVLKDKENDKDTIFSIKKTISIVKDEISKEIEKTTDKKVLKSMNDTIKYFERCNKELLKMIE